MPFLIFGYELKKVFSTEAFEFVEGKSTETLVTRLKKIFEAEDKPENIDIETLNKDLNDQIKKAKIKFEFYIGKFDGKFFGGAQCNADDIDEGKWVIKITAEQDGKFDVALVEGKKKKEEKKDTK